MAVSSTVSIQAIRAIPPMTRKLLLRMLSIACVMVERASMVSLTIRENTSPCCRPLYALNRERSSREARVRRMS